MNEPKLMTVADLKLLLEQAEDDDMVEVFIPMLPLGCGDAYHVPVVDAGFGSRQYDDGRTERCLVLGGIPTEPINKPAPLPEHSRLCGYPQYPCVCGSAR